MLRAEFTVEPFVVGNRGPHVEAAVGAARASGLPVEDGPFGIVVEGEEEQVLTTVAAVLAGAVGQGATRVTLQLSRALGTTEGSEITGD